MSNHVLFAALDDPTEPSSGQNAHYLAAENLAIGGRVCGPARPRGLSRALPLLETVRFGRRGFGRSLYCTGSAARHYARYIERRRENSEFVLVNQPVLASFLQPPYAIHTDSCASLLLELGGYLDGMTPRAFRTYEELEARAFSQASAIFATSEWARTGIARRFGVRAEFVPIGANINPPKTGHEKTYSNQLNLLFFGGDWERKGGPLAQEVAESIDAVVPCHLHCIGPEPSVNSHLVTSHGRLDKSDPRQMQEFSELCRLCDLMVLPTLSDCSPVAPAEVAAFGVPTLIRDVGGTRSSLTENVSGWVMSGEADAGEWADAIMRLYANGTLARARDDAKAAYRTTFNWTAAFSQMMTTIGE